jgi:hypothetical protein
VISCDDYFMPYDPDLPASSVDAELDYTFYHLWGAKKYQNDRSNPFFGSSAMNVDDLMRGMGASR